MNKLIKLSQDNLEQSVSLASDFLNNNGVIAVPTDTIYGLACLVNSNKALERIYEIKKRDSTKPLAIAVSDVSEIYHVAEVTVAKEILEDLLPGKVTLIFKRKHSLNSELNPQTDLIGVRIPDSEFVRELSRKVGPLALTSANMSSQQSTIQVEEFQELWIKLSAVFDGGSLEENDPGRLGSTVVDLSNQGFYKILRDGCAKESTISTLQSYGLAQLSK